jgi:hypothetical protein
MNTLTLIPVGLFGFLGGIAAGQSRKGLSMTKPSSPLGNVPIVQWERFVSLMAVSPQSYRSPRGRMGRFGMDARRLADVGFMDAPRKMTIGSETGIWVGEWKKPLDEKKFLGELPVQYEAFKRSMQQMAPRVAPLVGTKVQGVICSLSGLLGVGHLAGEVGVRSWVENPEVRQRFKATTNNFIRTNGVF